MDIHFRIELHPAITEPLPISLVDITARVWPLDAQPGANTYASNAALFCHLLLHATGGMRANTMLGCSHRSRAPRAAAHARGVVRAHRRRRTRLVEVSGAADGRAFFPDVIPADALAAARAACPALLIYRSALHDLAEVSWTNLSIPALPGYEWSRTPLELLRYARSRLLPKRQALAELAETAVANQPALQRVPWYNQSHLTRILRWVTSRPPRVQTIATVLAGQTRQ